MKLKAGEVWLTDSRKGKLTIKLLEDVNTEVDTFFEAEILEGNASYASIGNQLQQKVFGLGTPGTVESFRTTLCFFKNKVRPMTTDKAG